MKQKEMLPTMKMGKKDMRKEEEEMVPTMKEEETASTMMVGAKEMVPTMKMGEEKMVPA